MSSVTPNEFGLSREQRSGLLALLRNANAAIQRDVESFHESATVLEHVGQVLYGRILSGLGSYRTELLSLARTAPDIQHIRIEQLFKTVIEARNDAVHGGAYIRHHSTHLVELLLIFQEALMSPMTEVQDLMVRNPTTAESWHNIATVRRAMLANSFSYLPVETSLGKWQVISDFALIAYLRNEDDSTKRGERLGQQLMVAVNAGKIQLENCCLCEPTALIEEIVKEIRNAPVLVVESQGNKKLLVGILTAFDLL